ncbi:MAG: signal recognition particle protein Srp19 [Methanomicrobiales archaeon]|nr:signal recognition particle protein Srp19 [Methanomicrobiales archaeon]
MKGERVLYPGYFDLALGRSEGRRVPKSAAVPDPKLADLERAAKKLGLSYRTEAKPHPAQWIKREGRLVVTWEESKEDLLKKMAKKMGRKR